MASLFEVGPFRHLLLVFLIKKSYQKLMSLSETHPKLCVETLEVNRVVTFKVTFPSLPCHTFNNLKAAVEAELVRSIQQIPFPTSGRLRGVSIFVIPPPVGWVISFNISVEDSLDSFFLPLDSIVSSVNIRLGSFSNQRRLCVLI